MKKRYYVPSIIVTYFCKSWYSVWKTVNVRAALNPAVDDHVNATRERACAPLIGMTKRWWGTTRNLG